MKLLTKSLLISLLILVCTHTANSQVLISLLFGSALNTDKIEFGLIGGGNRSFILDIEESNGLNSFNLGFYFPHFIERKFLSKYRGAGQIKRWGPGNGILSNRKSGF